MTAQEMFDKAIQELDCLEKGDMFIVKDLFKGYIWNKQKRSERLLLGSLFLNYVKQNLEIFRLREKNSSGQQRYEKL